MIWNQGFPVKPRHGLSRSRDPSAYLPHSRIYVWNFYNHIYWAWNSILHDMRYCMIYCIFVLNLLQCSMWFVLVKDLSLDVLSERWTLLKVCLPFQWWCRVSPSPHLYQTEWGVQYETRFSDSTCCQRRCTLFLAQSVTFCILPYVFSISLICSSIYPVVILFVKKSVLLKNFKKNVSWDCACKPKVVLFVVCLFFKVSFMLMKKLFPCTSALSPAGELCWWGGWTRSRVLVRQLSLPLKPAVTTGCKLCYLMCQP